MKIEKNKIVFAVILAVLFAFLISYSMLIMGDDEGENENLEQTLIPELDQHQKEYDSKLEALDDLKEVRETQVPSIYEEKLIDSLGFYRQDLVEIEKERIVDSIYAVGKLRYSQISKKEVSEKRSAPVYEKPIDSTMLKQQPKITTKELGLAHQLFFATRPIENNGLKALTTDSLINVRVDGTQTLKNNDRIRMRLKEAAKINGDTYPKNTPIYGFVSFKPNRTIIDIEHINHQPVHLQAYDYQDGSEGIYIENSFREEISNEVLGDMIDDINIPGVPQVGGLKNVFRRNQRNVKVTVLDNYNLILRISKPQNIFQFN